MQIAVNIREEGVGKVQLQVECFLRVYNSLSFIAGGGSLKCRQWLCMIVSHTVNL